jgi:hypothetical protein
MWGFAWLPNFPRLIETLLDATLLSILSAPVVYFFGFRPIKSHFLALSRLDSYRGEMTQSCQQAP